MECNDQLLCNVMTTSIITGILLLPPPPPPMSSIPRGPDSQTSSLAKSSTWSYRPGFGNPSNLVPLNSGERIRPERVGRRALHSLTQR